jgi:hypothetical protein
MYLITIERILGLILFTLFLSAPAGRELLDEF